MDLSSIRRQVSYEMDATALDAGTAKVRAHGDAAQKTAAQTELFTRQSVLQEASITRVGSKLDAYSRSNDKAAAALANVERGERLIAAARANGLQVTDAHVRALEAARAKYDVLSKGVNDNTQAATLNRMQLMEVGHVARAFADEIAAGANPLRALTLEGGRIAEIFSQSPAGVGGTLRAMAAAMIGAISPTTAAIGVITAGAYISGKAFFTWREQVDALTISLNGMGRASGFTTGQVNGIAEHAAAAGGISNASGRALAAQYLSAGVSGGSLGGAIGLTQDFSRKLGLPFEGASKMLAQSLADPTKGAEELARQFGFVTYSEREQIKQLQAVGDKSGASAKLLAALAGQLERMRDPTMGWQKILEHVENWFSNAFGDLGQLVERKLGLAPSFKDVSQSIIESQRRAREAASSQAQERSADLGRLRQDAALAVQAIQARSFDEKAAVEIERARLAAMRETNDAVKAGIAAESKRAELIAEGNRKANDNLRSVQDQAALSGLSPHQRMLKEIEIKYRDLNEQTAPGKGVDSAVVIPFNNAGTAANRLADAFDDLVGRITHEGGKRIINVSRPGGGSDPRGLSGYIHDRALAYGIDPAVALRVAGSEGLGNPIGDNGTSFGAFQLHTGGGLGDTFKSQTGLDPSNPANERATIDFALKMAAKVGWGPWHGAARVGIGQFDGIGAQAGAGGSPIVSTARGTSDRAQALETMTKSQEELRAPIRAASQALAEQNKLLDAQVEAFGKDDGEVAKINERMKLYIEFQRQGIEVTPELSKRIEEQAQGAGDNAKRRAGLAEEQRKLVEAMDLVRNAASGGTRNIPDGS